MKVFKYHVETNEGKPCALAGFHFHPQGLLRPCGDGETAHDFGDYHREGKAKAAQAIDRTYRFRVAVAASLIEERDAILLFTTSDRFAVRSTPSATKQRRGRRLAFA